MDLEPIKNHRCPQDQGEGILLADIDEKAPRTDKQGRLLYYCPENQHIFAVMPEQETRNFEGRELLLK